MNETTRAVLRRLSAGGIDLEASRRFADLKSIAPLKILYRTMDYKVFHQEEQIPVRIYFPDETALQRMGLGMPVLLFFHGGGWVTESVPNYDKICARLSRMTGQLVVSVDYRLAPEHPFPAGLEDCYAVAKALFTRGLDLGFDTSRVTLVGDSAGGNLAAAVSLLAARRGEFRPAQQILIYPVTGNDYTDQSPFPSVEENGTDYFLTARKMQDYIHYYKTKEEDLYNPLFAPILAEQKELEGQPRTLILTGQLDPLRDEGEAYGEHLAAAGCQVECYRIPDAVHGYFALGISSPPLTECLGHISDFLKEGECTHASDLTLEKT